MFRRPSVLLAAALAIAMSSAAAQTAKPGIDADDPAAAGTAASSVPLEEIRRFVGVYNVVKDGYVDKVDDKALMESAIRGLLLDLDPHSVYLPKSDAQAFDEDANGRYAGIGVEVQELPDGTIRIIAPLDGSPAQRAGLRSGDLVVAIDGIALTPGVEARHPLRGEVGSTVKVTIQRAGTAKPLDITLTRDVVRVGSVRHDMREPGYGYIRISQFQTDTAGDFETALAALQQSAGGRLNGLVIDLRSNPGGLLTSAVQIADDLLDKGVIVSTRGRLASSETVFSATPGDRAAGVPVVLLVDAGSASASEVLAGALRDNNRARIVGSRTFGKGLVQSVMDLPNGDAVKLTTARYYTPKGISIQAKGIVPDVSLDVPGAPRAPAPSEAGLPGHLQAEGGDPKDVVGGQVLEGDAPIKAALAELKRKR